MKAAVTAFVLAVFLAVPALAQQAVPNLVGTWKSTHSSIHHKAHGYQERDMPATLVVHEQKDRVFHGEVEWGGKGPGKDTFSGVVDKDNITFYVAGHSEGLRIGKMEGKDAFTFYYVIPGGQNPRAGYAEYQRAK